jgi:hypothetical protein
MGRSRYEVQLSVTQSFHTFSHRKYVLQFRLQAFGLEETELNGGNGWKVGIRDQVGHSDAHRSLSFGGCI